MFAKQNKCKVKDEVTPIPGIYSKQLRVINVSNIRNLLISDSQGKRLDIANFTVLSLPGAKVEHVYNSIPKKALYNNIVLFIGGNNWFAVISDNFVRQISDFANLVLTKTKRVFVLGIP